MKLNIGNLAVAFWKQNREVNRFLGETTLFVAVLIGLAVSSQASVMNNGALAKEPQNQSAARSTQQNPSNGVIGTAFSYTWHPEVGKPILHFVRHSSENTRFDSNDSSAPLTVLVLLGADSLTMRRAIQTVESLQNQYTGRAIRFVGIAVGVSADALSTFAHTHDLTIPLLVDPHGQLANEFAAGNAPYSCIWDSAGIARYYGPLDDSTDHTAAHHHYLRDAMGASLRPSQLTTRRTSAHSHCGA